MATSSCFSPVNISSKYQQVQLLFVGMELIVSAKVGEEHARIMAECQDGIDI